MREPRVQHAVFGLALAALLAGVLAAGGLRYRSWESVPALFKGSKSYSTLALAWADGGALRPGRPPVYPLFLGITAKGFGVDAYAPAAVVEQAILLLGIFLLTYVLGWRAGGRPVWGFVASAAVVANGLLIREFLGLRETVLYCAWVMLLFALVGARAWRGVPGCLALGLLCSLGCLTRPTGILLAPAVGSVWLWDEWGRVPASARTPRMASFALALSLPLLLWWGYQSHRDLGGSLVASYAAANYFKGNNEAMTAFYPFVDVDHMTPHMREMKAQAASTGRDPALDLVRRALEFQRSSPLDTLALVPRKLAAFFVPIRFPLGSGEVQRAADGEWEIVGYRPIRLRRHLLGIAALPGIVCFFIALTRIRRLPPAVQFSTLLVLSTAGIHLVTFAQTRFRLPFDPILAVSFVAIASAWRARATGGGPSTP